MKEIHDKAANWSIQDSSSEDYWNNFEAVVSEGDTSSSEQERRRARMARRLQIAKLELSDSETSADDESTSIAFEKVVPAGSLRSSSLGSPELLRKTAEEGERPEQIGSTQETVHSTVDEGVGLEPIRPVEASSWQPLGASQPAAPVPWRSRDQSSESGTEQDDKADDRVAQDARWSL